MSDMQCAATVIVARHAEAEFDTEGVSDDGGWLSLEGRAQAIQLGESLRDRRIATIWTSDLSRAVQTAEIVASGLGAVVKVRSGLREFSVGDWAGQPDAEALVRGVFAAWVAGDLSVGPPGAETGFDVVRRWSGEIGSLVDQYRGETSLMISHGGVTGVVLPRLVNNVPADYAVGRPLGNRGTCELAADSDGWVLRTWADQPV